MVLRLHGWITLLGVLALTGASIGQNSPPDDDANVPGDDLARLAQWLQPPPGTIETPRDRERLRARHLRQAQHVIEHGYDLIDRFPEADNLSVVRQYMLAAAVFVHEAESTEVNRQQLISIADAILESSDAPAEKLRADVATTGLALRDADEAQGRAALVDLMDRYDPTPAAAEALISAAALAGRHGWHDLFAQCVDQLEADHLDDGQAVRFLARIGRKAPFRSAALTDLDQQTLTLPDDFSGQVVLVVFWATWCEQSERSEAHLRKLHADYGHHGLEIVGISLDGPDRRDALRDYIREHQLNWTHTYSGQGVDDATFRHYHLNETPSIWLLDGDGNVATDNALIDRSDPDRGSDLNNLERNVRRLLEAPGRSDTDGQTRAERT